MNAKQCPGCSAMVDSAKAYCPDCGAPMDEELKSSDQREFDALIKTQRINKTMQLRMLEEFNLSQIFAQPKLDEAEKNQIRQQNNQPAVQQNSQPVVRDTPQNQPPINSNIPAVPQNEVVGANNNNQKIEASQKPEIIQKTEKPKSYRNLFIVLGSVLFLFFAAVLSGAAFIYWYYFR